MTPPGSSDEAQVSSVRFEPAGSLRGRLHPPPDKSISHRAALIGAMAEGRTRVYRYLDSADTRSTLGAIEAVGAGVSIISSDDRGGLEVDVEGVGLRGPSGAGIDVGNAGTLIRLMPGWLAGQAAGEWSLDGDDSIRGRPVDRVMEPLRQMGAEIECRDGRLPPLVVRGSELRGIDYELPMASAQVKSCLLIAGLLAEGETTVREPVPTRDHTERMLAAAGARLRRDGDAITVSPAERLEPAEIPVPGDLSSAAFFLAAALIVPGSELWLEGTGLNKTRMGLLSVLSAMGVEMEQGSVGGKGIAVEDIGEAGGESFGTLHATSSALRGTEVTPEQVPRAIDELPLVALLGCFAEGETFVRGAGELRRKESDRIAGVVEGLGGLGAEIEAAEDGFRVHGGGLRGGEIDARGDHRLAMLGAIAGLASREGVEVHGFDAVKVSYPGFERDLRLLLSC
ncbi:MAG: 3-phosphoshikimate 1-carboxyvinyltransferase [Solirubrobacterales bacterium]|nr:3-phosphoshikimate 1-carboxyvinyltransferase [Solirubrobacterales bacterium]